MLTTVIKSGIFTSLFFLWTVASWAADNSTVSLDLVRDGAPAATIVVAYQPTRAAQLAAAELQYHVRKITGATLPIVDDKQAVAGNRVLVGESQATMSLGLKNDDFTPQEYLIRFRPNILILMGRDKPDRGKLDYADVRMFPTLSDEQGTCYAVYDFLERHAQVRWYLPTELGLCCPAAKTLQVSGGEVRRSPAMKYRAIGDDYCRFPEDLCGDTVNGLKPPSSLPLREQFLFAMRHRLGGVLPYAANHSLYGYYDRFWKGRRRQTRPRVRTIPSRVLCPRLSGQAAANVLYECRTRASSGPRRPRLFRRKGTQAGSVSSRQLFFHRANG